MQRLLSEKSEEFKNVIPSKIFENVAYDVPILLGLEGEAKKLVKNYGVGFCYEPENIASFMNSLSKLKKLISKNLKKTRKK